MKGKESARKVAEDELSETDVSDVFGGRDPRVWSAWASHPLTPPFSIAVFTLVSDLSFEYWPSLAFAKNTTALQSSRAEFWCKNAAHARRKIWYKSLKETNLGVAPTSFDLLRIPLPTFPSLLSLTYFHWHVSVPGGAWLPLLINCYSWVEAVCLEKSESSLRNYRTRWFVKLSYHVETFPAFYKCHSRS